MRRILFFERQIILESGGEIHKKTVSTKDNKLWTLTALSIVSLPSSLHYRADAGCIELSELEHDALPKA